MDIVYWSGATKNTERLVKKFDLERRHASQDVLNDSILFMPSYGSGGIPKDIRRLLSHEENRNKIKAVVGTGNLNFGPLFCLAAEKVANKLGVPLLAKVEIFGTPEDVEYINKKIGELAYA